METRGQQVNFPVKRRVSLQMPAVEKYYCSCYVEPYNVHIDLWAALAMTKDQILELSDADRSWFNRAQSHILSKVRTEYGVTSFNSQTDNLIFVQKLIDDGKVRSSDLLESQCIGVVLGNLFVSNSCMRWKRVINEYGNLLALHSDRIGFTLYPLSMVSKRIEDGRPIELESLYNDVMDSLHLRDDR